MPRKLPFLQTDSKIPPKTFVFDSQDNYLSNILTANGWLSLPRSSCLFQLKWVFSPTREDFNELKPNQIINHFKESYLLTTKIGMMKTLSKNLNGYLSIYPRSYDLNQQFEYFSKDFNHTAIMNLLKKFIIFIEMQVPNLFNQLHKLTLKIRNSDNYLEILMKNRSIFENIINPKLVFNQRIFVHLLLYLNQTFSLSQNLGYRIDTSALIEYSKHDPPYQQVLETTPKSLQGTPSKQSLYLLMIYYKIAKQSKWFLNDGYNNIWIIKANQSSRARSIFIVDNIQDAKFYNNGNRIIQKYIENIWILTQSNNLNIQKYPFLEKLVNKKFDIRVWVLVKSFNPFISYIYPQGYLRISSHQYQFNDLSHFKSHLTNYSINSQQFIHSEDSYVLLSDFITFLEQQYQHFGIFKDIKNLINLVLKSADVGYNQHCFQLYGFDILLDYNLKPWLLQCNMSPACKERGKLKQILYQMGQGMLNLLGILPGQNNKWEQLDQILQVKINQKDKKNNIKFKIEGKQFNMIEYILKEKFHYQIQNIIILQRYFKNHYNKKKTQICLSRSTKKIARIKIIIATLAKITKKYGRNYFKEIAKKIKIKKSSKLIIK